MAVSLGTILKNQISVVDFLDQREIYSKVVDVTRERTAFNMSMLMQKMGKYVVSKMTNYHSFVNVELYQKETISAVPTDNGGGLNWTYVVASANGTSTHLVGETVQIPDAGRTQGIVTTRVPDAGGDIITIQALNGAMTLTNGDVLAIVSNAGEEGGGFVAAKNWKPVKKQNNIQIFAKDIATISDIQMETWIEVSTNGQFKYLAMSELNGYFSFMKELSMQFLFGEGSGDNFISASPTITGTNGRPVSTTRGVHSHLALEGLNFPGATFNQALLETIATQMDQRRCPALYQVWTGTKGSIAMDNLFLSLAGSSISANSRWEITGNDVSLGINKYEIYGRTFAKVPMQAFNEQNQTSFTGSAGFQNMMFFIPDGGDVGLADGGSAPYLRCRYLPVGPSGTNASSNGIYRSTRTGNYAPTATNKTRTLDISYETKQGIEFFGANFGARVILT